MADTTPEATPAPPLKGGFNSSTRFGLDTPPAPPTPAPEPTPAPATEPAPVPAPEGAA